MNRKIPKNHYGLGHVASIALFLIGLFIFFNYVESDFMQELEPPYLRLVYFFVPLYVGAQLVAAIIDFVMVRFRFTFKNFFLLWWTYLIVTLVNLLAIILAFPLLAILFLLGPAVFLVFLIAVGVLIFYLIENVLGVDIKNTSVPEEMGGYAILAIIGCLGLMWLYARMGGEDNLMDKYADFFVHRIQHPVRVWEERLLEGMDA